MVPCCLSQFISKLSINDDILLIKTFCKSSDSRNPKHPLVILLKNLLTCQSDWLELDTAVNDQSDSPRLSLLTRKLYLVMF